MTRSDFIARVCVALANDNSNPAAIVAYAKQLAEELDATDGFEWVLESRADSIRQVRKTFAPPAFTDADDTQYEAPVEAETRPAQPVDPEAFPFKDKQPKVFPAKFDTYCTRRVGGCGETIEGGKGHKIAWFGKGEQYHEACYRELMSDAPF